MRLSWQGIGSLQPALAYRRASILESEVIVMNETAARVGRN